MSRIVLAVGIVAALLAFARRRRRWVPDEPDDMAAVQVDIRPYIVSEPVGGM